MAVFHKKLSVTGQANKTIWDTGIASTEQERKHIVAVILHTTGHIGNDVLGYLEREEVLEVPDYLTLTDEEGSTDKIGKVVVRPIRFEVDRDIPIGQTFKIGLKCGGTLKTLVGVYIYRIA